MKFLRLHSMTLLSVAVLACACAIPAAAQVKYFVTVDTSSVSGMSGIVDMQFNPGGASEVATAQVVGFTVNGGSVSGSPTLMGDAAGTLPGTLAFQNTAPDNEYYQNITFGSSVTFELVLSGPAITSPNGSTDGTSFFLSFYTPGFGAILLTNDSAGPIVEADIDTSTNPTTITAEGFTEPEAEQVSTCPPLNSSNCFGNIFLITPDATQVNYAPNLNVGDSVVNITNTGSSGGNICVNAYAFDPSEEMVSCCACLVTPDGLQSLSDQGDLISNTISPSTPTAITITLVASAPVAGGCNPASPTFASVVPGMEAWGTKLHALPTSPASYGVTETKFQDANLNSEELTRLTAFCSFIQSNGSGFGVCKSCRTGGLAGSKK